MFSGNIAPSADCKRASHTSHAGLLVPDLSGIYSDNPRHVIRSCHMKTRRGYTLHTQTKAHTQKKKKKKMFSLGGRDQDVLVKHLNLKS